MRIFAIIVFSLLLFVVGVQLYNVYGKSRKLNNQFSEVETKIESLNKENSKLLADIDYFQDPRNLIKEFKSKFNYKKLGEKLIIVVPKSGN